MGGRLDGGARHDGGKRGRHCQIRVAIQKALFQIRLAIQKALFQIPLPGTTCDSTAHSAAARDSKRRAAELRRPTVAWSDSDRAMARPAMARPAQPRPAARGAGWVGGGSASPCLGGPREGRTDVGERREGERSGDTYLKLQRK